MEGLAHVHDAGYVHSDLKPENVLLTKHNEVKLADFGLSSPLPAEDGEGNFSQRRVGSPPYWSPEQLANYDYNGVKSDLYAVGIMLFIMIFGSRPFTEAKTTDQLFGLLMKNHIEFWLTHPVTK